jgi:hypothetical protein
MRESIARIGILFALFMVAFGQVITFVPGFGARRFGFAAVCALASLVSRSWQMRVVAILIAIYLGGLAWLSYLHGSRYQDFLSQRSITTPAHRPRE